MVTTHFMEEAEYCDRLAIMADGEILALGTPEEIKQRQRTAEQPEPTMEDAFIALIEGRPRATEGRHDRSDAGHGIRGPRGARGRGMRLRGLLRKEFFQILRDPSSIAIAFLLPVVLLLIFGYGVSLDAEHVPIALVVEQPSADTASFTGGFQQSRYFEPVFSATCARPSGADGRAAWMAIVHLRSDFARQLRQPRRRADPGDRQRRGRQHRPAHRGLRAGRLAEMAAAPARWPGARRSTLPVAVRAAGLVQQRTAQPQFPGARL